MNSSVTCDSATSVTSSWCLAISPQQQVERALEAVEVDREGGRLHLSRRYTSADQRAERPSRARVGQQRGRPAERDEQQREHARRCRCCARRAGARPSASRAVRGATREQRRPPGSGGSGTRDSAPMYSAIRPEQQQRPAARGRRRRTRPAAGRSASAPPSGPTATPNAASRASPRASTTSGPDEHGAAPPRRRGGRAAARRAAPSPRPAMAAATAPNGSTCRRGSGAQPSLGAQRGAAGAGHDQRRHPAGRARRTTKRERRSRTNETRVAEGVQHLSGRGAAGHRASTSRARSR